MGYITTTTMNISGREFVLAEVARGMSQLGVFRYSSNEIGSTDVFYIEQEPIMKIINPRRADPLSNKHIVQISGADKGSEIIAARLTTAVENLFRYNQGVAQSATPVLEMLKPGLYVVHESQMHPSDGNGNFFWNAFVNRREIEGSADRNTIIGNSNYAPCFLIPTKLSAGFNVNKMYVTGEQKTRNSKVLGGVAYHISGMFSALLEGHHAAAASLINNLDFRCLVIEPVNDVIYSDESDKKKRRIIALSCPYVKIPLKELPDTALERFLVTRKHIKPESFDEIKSKMTKTIRAASKRAFPGTIYEKSEQLPDCTMVESASSVNALSEEQLTALQSGEVKHNEEYVVSANYYSSVVAASNYLQTTDFSRFLDFAIAILNNPELTSVHKYITERLLLAMHPAINEYFTSVIETHENSGDSADSKQDIIIESARKYVERWRDYVQRKQSDFEDYARKRQKAAEDMKAITETKGITTLEMAVRGIGDMPRK